MSQTGRRYLLIAVIALVLILAVYIIVTQSNSNQFSGSQLGPDEIPGEVVYIPFPVEIKLDGDLSDWAGIPVSEVIDEDARDPAENGSFQFQVAADRKNFYITMQMPDKTIIAGEHRHKADGNIIHRFRVFTFY